MKAINVLITGSGAPGAPGIIKSLRNNNERKINIIGVDVNPRNSGIYLVDGFFKIPKPNDKDFIPCLLDICVKSNIDVILPLVTKELISLSRNRKLFDNNNIKISISSEETLKVANNKASLYRFLDHNSIPVPSHVLVNNIDQFKIALESLGYPKKKVCFKPPESNGSRGFRIIDDSLDQLDLLLNYKPNNTYISYHSIVDILSNSHPFPELLVMEYLPGAEYSVDLLVQEGRPIYTIPRYREEIKAGISSVGLTIDNEDIIEYCNLIVRKLMLNGNIGIQVKENEEGEFRILEINPRVQGTIVLCTGAGVNLPYLAIKLALNEKIDENLKVKWKTTMLRYYSEVFISNTGEYFQL